MYILIWICAQDTDFVTGSVVKVLFLNTMKEEALEHRPRHGDEGAYP